MGLFALANVGGFIAFMKGEMTLTIIFVGIAVYAMVGNILAEI